MTTFQLVAIPLLVVMALLSGAATARHRVSRRVGVAWVILWLAAAVSIAEPMILVVLARWLGIGRGADLLFYLAILAGFVAFFATYLRLRRVDEQLTAIIRHLAIREGLRDGMEPSDDGADKQ